MLVQLWLMLMEVVVVVALLVLHLRILLLMSAQLVAAVAAGLYNCLPFVRLDTLQNILKIVCLSWQTAQRHGETMILFSVAIKENHNSL